MDELELPEYYGSLDEDDIISSEITVLEEDAGKRVDVCISGFLPDISRSLIQKHIKDGQVLVNGQSTKVNYKVKPKDIISVSIKLQNGLTDAVPEDIPLDIVYEDDDVVVINKPRGMVVHPAPGHNGGTLVNALLFHENGQVSDINGLTRPGIVHRIDRDTSGLLVCAKNNTSHIKLAAQLEEHSMTRRYKALVFNSFSEQEGTVDKPIARSKNDRKKMAVDEKNGRRAVTHYRVIEELGRYSYIECVLETGRTHQIRVHMKYIGHPVIGDPVYSSAKMPFKTLGQLLHAGILGFVHPSTGEYMEFEAPLPEDFSNALQFLRKL